MSRLFPQLRHCTESFLKPKLNKKNFNKILSGFSKSTRSRFGVCDAQAKRPVVYLFF